MGVWEARGQMDKTYFLCPWDSLVKNTGVGSHSLSQGIFPTQGSNPGLQDCRQIPYHLSHQGSPIVQSSENKYYRKIRCGGWGKGCPSEVGQNL